MSQQSQYICLFHFYATPDTMTGIMGTVIIMHSMYLRFYERL